MATPGCRARLCAWEGPRLCQRAGCPSLAEHYVLWWDEDVRTGVGEVAVEDEAADGGEGNIDHSKSGASAIQ